MRRFVSSRSGESVADAPAPPWQLTVRRWPALRRTRVALSGTPDSQALEALAGAVEEARARGDAVSLDLGELTSCPPGLAASYRAARRSPPPANEISETGR
jgi:hypothetical protein